MPRIKPEQLACQNVLMRKENQEGKRTKDWKLATILGILFTAGCIPFCLALLRANHFFISDFSFERKDHTSLTACVHAYMCPPCLYHPHAPARDPVL